MADEVVEAPVEAVVEMSSEDKLKVFDELQSYMKQSADFEQQITALSAQTNEKIFDLRTQKHAVDSKIVAMMVPKIG